MSAAVCPRCGFANAPENRFCANCGNPLGGSGPIGAAPFPPPFAPAPPWTGGPAAPARSNNTVLIIVIIVLLVGASISAPLLFYILAGSLRAPGGSQGPRAIGIAPARSADGTNWTLTFTSVPSGLSTSSTRLTIITSGGSTALASTPLNALVYATAKAAYVQAVVGSSVGVGDRLLISTTTYPTGYQYQISDGTAVLASGLLQG